MELAARSAGRRRAWRLLFEEGVGRALRGALFGHLGLKPRNLVLEKTDALGKLPDR